MPVKEFTKSIQCKFQGWNVEGTPGTGWKNTLSQCINLCNELAIMSSFTGADEELIPGKKDT